MENKNVMKKVVVITISALLCVIPLLQSLQASTYASTITDKKVLKKRIWLSWTPRCLILTL